MSRLDYEKSRRYTKTSDYAHDDLPPTGSWSDRKRYLSESQHSSVFTSRRPTCSGSCSKPVAQSLRADLEQLEKYVTHAERTDFSRKAQVQKVDVISIIKRLLLRDAIQAVKPPSSDAQICGRAQQLVALYSH